MDKDLISSEEILAQICEYAAHFIPDGDRGHFHTFTSQFLERMPPEQLTRISIESHGQRMTGLWNFYRERPFGEPKIDISFQGAEISEQVSERIVINIINDDMSFLVDSLVGLLNRHGMAPRLLLHPIFHVRRNESGYFTAFEDRGKTEDINVMDESFIHCEITDGITPALVDFLKEKLPHILVEIRRANQDWQPMREKVDLAVVDVGQGAFGNDISEICHFLEWIRNDHFTFLGYCYYELRDKKGKLLPEPEPRDALGILRDSQLQDLRVMFEGIDYDGITRRLFLKRDPFLINKSSQISHIHRPVLMDAIGIKRIGKNGKPQGIHLFAGLFTSIAYDSSARDIPWLRKKIDAVLDEAHLSPAWHDGKGLVHILDSLPRDELFQASIPELKSIGLKVLQLQSFQKISLFVRPDSFRRFLSCLVYIPGDRFTSALAERIGDILVEAFGGFSGTMKAQFGSLAMARVHYIISIPGGVQSSYDLEAVQARLIHAARSWLDDLRIDLADHFGEFQGGHLFRLYNQAFTEGYREHFTGQEVIQDIHECERIRASGVFGARVYQDHGKGCNSFHLKIYNPHHPLPLSDILPVLENLDTRVLSEIPFRISPGGGDFPVWIHEFELASRGNYTIDLRERGSMFMETLHLVRQKVIEDDAFNRLVLGVGLDWREVGLIRACYCYLKQLNIPFTESTIQNALASNPEITRKLVALFHGRFNPDRVSDPEAIYGEITQLLHHVKASDDDRILRRYLNIIQAMVRTNYFQKTMDGNYRECLSIKFDCSQVDDMPLPRPMFEIFVYSPRVEGVHLRGGKVARGGIRWSDRVDDYRTEVLGLMKAQMVKNVVIVPVGSKGGFIVKSMLSAGASRDEVIAEAVSCYKTMIGGMLDITDNLKDGNVISPPDTVCYDGEDPYLVVAADKGTASFSDHANAVSRGYGFWLDDAFASGGSDGYDHKKMGITARGAWESVCHHFHSMGIDPSRDTIRVVGVGDMSGDVFGNGMLLSDKIKLVAAFNHMHIFIDPDPNPTFSFGERKRLFKLPRSTWKDYDAGILSEGGGIFDRTARTIPLSPQIRSMLGTDKETITPDELIRALLTLDVDLLWFGGIGTFVKSSHESNQDVGDKANDAVRVNGQDLRCRVVAEGANLGVTQLGRIEYSHHVRGRINTDAIDNSAGVDTSDHEVNIKILLRQLMDQGDMSREERNVFLEDMTDDVARLVLSDNRLQNRCISLVEWQAGMHLDEDVRLIHMLERKGILKRSLEFLPDDARLAEYQSRHQGLSRPEIAVLMAYAKLNLFDELIQTGLPDEPWLEDILAGYFPEMLRKQYPAAIQRHPLRREIIATCVVNQMINRTGPTFIHELQDKTGSSFVDVTKAFLLAVHVFEFEKMWSAIEDLDQSVVWDQRAVLYHDLLKILKRLVGWSLKNMHLYGDLNLLASKLVEGVEFFIRDLHDCLDSEARAWLASLEEGYCRMDTGNDLAQRLAILTVAASSPDILLISDRSGIGLKSVAVIYYMVASRFRIGSIRQELQGLIQTSHWGRLVLRGLQEDLYSCHNELVYKVIEKAMLEGNREDTPSRMLETWIAANYKMIERYDCLTSEVVSSPVRDLSMYTTLLRELRNMTY